MQYEQFTFSAGVLIGYFLRGYLRENVGALVRVRNASGVPIRKMNRERARNLDNFLSSWSTSFSAIYEFIEGSEVRNELPAQVQQAWDKHIHYNNIEIYASSLNAEEILRSWQVLFSNRRLLKQQVREFYREPPVVEYLRA